MNPRHAFLAQIRATPDDDAPRLIYADWLDEQGEEAQARFIRLQCRLAQLEREHDTDLDRYQRSNIIQHLANPLNRPDWPEWTNEFAAIERERNALYKQHRSPWLGNVAELVDDPEACCTVVYERGFLERLSIGVSAFINTYDPSWHKMPMLQDLTIIGLHHQGDGIARQLEYMPKLRRLHFAGWMTEHCAAELANCVALRSLESLSLWVGDSADQDVLWILKRFKFLANLKELVLVDFSSKADPNYDVQVAQADHLARDYNQFRKAPIARVKRPSDGRFSIDERHVEAGLYAGQLRRKINMRNFFCGPALIVSHHRTIMLLLSDQGSIQDITEIRFEPQDEWEKMSKQDQWRFIQDRMDFTPAPVFVHEFSSAEANISLSHFGSAGNFVVATANGNEMLCHAVLEHCIRGSYCLTIDGYSMGYSTTTYPTY